MMQLGTFLKQSFDLNYRGNSGKQLGKVCSDHMGFRGAYTHSKLHCKFDITLNNSTVTANYYWYQSAY